MNEQALDINKVEDVMHKGVIRAASMPADRGCGHDGGESHPLRGRLERAGSE